MVLSANSMNGASRVDVWDRFLGAFDDPGRCARQTVYAYRIGSDRRLLKPYLFASQGGFDTPRELLEYLRDSYGGGEFRVFIRLSTKLMFCGTLRIGQIG